MPQVDRRDPVVGLLGQFLDRLVAAAEADPDIVVQDVNAPPPLNRRHHRRGEGRLARHVGLEGDAFAALLHGQRGGLLGRGEIAVDGEDTGALLREAQHRGAAIADALARTLPGADDDRDLPRETHWHILRKRNATNTCVEYSRPMTANPEPDKLRLWLARQLLRFAQLSGRNTRRLMRRAERSEQLPIKWLLLMAARGLVTVADGSARLAAQVARSRQ